MDAMLDAGALPNIVLMSAGTVEGCSVASIAAAKGAPPGKVVDAGIPASAVATALAMMGIKTLVMLT